MLSKGTYPIWGFPKIRATLWGGLIIRIIVFWGLYWGPLFWETTIYRFGGAFKLKDNHGVIIHDAPSRVSFCKRVPFGDLRYIEHSEQRTIVGVTEIRSIQTIWGLIWGLLWFIYGGSDFEILPGICGGDHKGVAVRTMRCACFGWDLHGSCGGLGVRV